MRVKEVAVILLAWIFGLYLLNMVCLLIVAIREVRKPTKALFWLTISLALPVIGFLFYLITSNPVSISGERLTSPLIKQDTLPRSFNFSTSGIAHALQPLSVHGLQAGRVQVLANGIRTYDKLIESLQNAHSTIDMEYFIYRDDQIGRRITDMMIKQSAAGVQIRFIRDGWGSRQFPKDQIIQMMNAGIECRTMFPLRFPWVLSNLTYRNHCKIVVIDGKEAFTGGINVGYEYTGLKPDVGFWRDTHVRIAGGVAGDLQVIFDSHWNIASPERVKMTIQQKRKLEDTPSRKIALPNFICITQASHSVDITTPYFVPDVDIIMALKTAVMRGVRVRLLVASQNDFSTLIVAPASRTCYGELLEAGVDIYQYNKGMLHAKLMVIDKEIAVVGTANYDTRSFRLDYEVCEVIYSTDVVRELTEQFNYDLTNSVALKIDDLRLRSVTQRIIEQGARLLSPML